MRFRLFAATTLLLVIVSMGAGQSGNVPPNVFGTSEYRLGPDDIIQVFVWKEPDLSTDVVIRPDGKVSLPLIGELPANGKTSLQLQNEIVVTMLSEFVSKPMVNVIVKEVNSAKVSVLGEVKNPGMYKIGNRATLLDAVAMAGGFTEYAKRDKIIVIRGTNGETQQRLRLDVDKLLKNDSSDLFYILPHDKVYVQ
jgi:polysaccharide export outer membrane protein